MPNLALAGPTTLFPRMEGSRAVPLRTDGVARAGCTLMPPRPANLQGWQSGPCRRKGPACEKEGGPPSPIVAEQARTGRCPQDPGPPGKTRPG